MCIQSNYAFAFKTTSQKKEIIKLGFSAKTIYRKNNQTKILALVNNNISEDEFSFLKDNFLIVSYIGNLVEGVMAFSYWCTQRNLPI